MHDDLVVDGPPCARDRARPPRGRLGVTFASPVCLRNSVFMTAVGDDDRTRRRAGPPARHAAAWGGDRSEAVRSRRSVPSATSVVGDPELGGFLLHVAFVGLASPLLSLVSVCLVPVLGAHALRARGRTIRLPSVPKKQPRGDPEEARRPSRSHVIGRPGGKLESMGATATEESR